MELIKDDKICKQFADNLLIYFLLNTSRVILLTTIILVFIIDKTNLSKYDDLNECPFKRWK